jgi:hypothetical protein
MNNIRPNNNWKIKYQGQLTFWVYKDYTNTKQILNKRTVVIYKQGSGFDVCVGAWQYEHPTKQVLLSWDPIKIKTVKIKNPKICFFHSTHREFKKEEREKCFEFANKRIELLNKEEI